MNSTGLQRMVRIACACDKAVDALQRVADMSDDDGVSRREGSRGPGSGPGGEHYMPPPSHESDIPISPEQSSENDQDDRHSRSLRSDQWSGLGTGLAIGLGLIPEPDDEINEDNDLGGPTPDINLSATIALQRVGLQISIHSHLHTLP